MIYTLCTMLKTVMVHQQKQYKFYNHNLSSLFQYLCITLVIKKLNEFEISTLDDFLNLFIKFSTNLYCQVFQSVNLMTILLSNCIKIGCCVSSGLTDVHYHRSFIVFFLSCKANAFLPCLPRLPWRSA